MSCQPQRWECGDEAARRRGGEAATNLAPIVGRGPKEQDAGGCRLRGSFGCAVPLAVRAAVWFISDQTRHQREEPRDRGQGPGPQGCEHSGVGRTSRSCPTTTGLCNIGLVTEGGGPHETFGFALSPFFVVVLDNPLLDGMSHWPLQEKRRSKLHLAWSYRCSGDDRTIGGTFRAPRAVGKWWTRGSVGRCGGFGGREKLEQACPDGIRVLTRETGPIISGVAPLSPAPTRAYTPSMSYSSLFSARAILSLCVTLRAISLVLQRTNFLSLCLLSHTSRSTSCSLGSSPTLPLPPRRRLPPQPPLAGLQTETRDVSGDTPLRPKRLKRWSMMIKRAHTPTTALHLLDGRIDLLTTNRHH